MHVKHILDESAADGSLYQALAENVAEIAEIAVANDPGEDGEDNLISGAITTFGYVLVDIAESLDRIADHFDGRRFD